jgi:hypothetical protein
MRNYPCRRVKSTRREGLGFQGGLTANEAQKWAGLVESLPVAQFWATPVRDGPELTGPLMEDGLRSPECRIAVVMALPPLALARLLPPISHLPPAIYTFYRPYSSIFNTLLL